jgi:hypothetical protein
VVVAASISTLSPTVSIAFDPMVPSIMQDPVVSTANPNTLSQVASNTVEAGRQSMQDTADETANLHTRREVISIAAEAFIHCIQDLIAKGVESAAQNIDSLRG